MSKSQLRLQVTGAIVGRAMAPALTLSEADLPVRRRPARAVFLSGDERLGIGFYQAFQARDSGVKLSRCQ